MHYSSDDPLGPIPPVHWSPRKWVISLFLILSFNNLIYSASWFLTDLATTLVQKLYIGYASILLLLLLGISFWITRVKIIAALFIFLTAATIFQLGTWAYYFSNALSKGNDVWIYFSVGVCCLAAILSTFTLRTSKSQVYQIYSSLERLIDLGFIKPKKNEFIWSHALTTYPRLGPYPTELPKLDNEKTSKLFGRFMVVGVYANALASVLVAVISDRAIMGIMVFALTLLSLLLGHGFLKMVLIFRINGKYREQYDADLVLPVNS